MDAVAKLNEMPLRFCLYEKEPWHSKGFRVLPIDKYLAFYLPVEAKRTVAVIRIFPYDGAKEHCVLGIDNAGLTRAIVAALEPVTQLPKPTKKKGQQPNG
ncbi:MAG: type II toxin-antitoxin system RelE/ParE family toxin [Desulfotomaculaceae bacterium]|nr:type II toxin-antitoxin system RelE/ParE family toxin [Desulfotomaculaceae bacterium]